MKILATPLTSMIENAEGGPGNIVDAGNEGSAALQSLEFYLPAQEVLNQLNLCLMCTWS